MDLRHLHGRRRVGHARAIRPHAHHRGEHRQREFHRATPDGEPYRRKIATMKSEFDRELERHAGHAGQAGAPT